MTYAAWWVPFLAGLLSHWLWSRTRQLSARPIILLPPPELHSVRIVDPPPYDWSAE